MPRWRVHLSFSSMARAVGDLGVEAPDTFFQATYIPRRSSSPTGLLSTLRQRRGLLRQTRRTSFSFMARAHRACPLSLLRLMPRWRVHLSFSSMARAHRARMCIAELYLVGLAALVQSARTLCAAQPAAFQDSAVSCCETSVIVAPSWIPGQTFQVPIGMTIGYGAGSGPDQLDDYRISDQWVGSLP